MRPTEPKFRPTLQQKWLNRGGFKPGGGEGWPLVPHNRDVEPYVDGVRALGEKILERQRLPEREISESSFAPSGVPRRVPSNTGSLRSQKAVESLLSVLTPRSSVAALETVRSTSVPT